MPDPSTVAASTHRPAAARVPQPGRRVRRRAAEPSAVARARSDAGGRGRPSDHGGGEGPRRRLRSSSRICRPSLRVSLRLSRAPASAPVSSGLSEKAELRTRAASRPGQLPRQRRARDEQQPAVHLVHAAPAGPRADVGTRPVGGAARGRHSVDLVQFGQQLDLDPHHRQRLGRDLDRECLQGRQCRAGAGGAADGGGGPRRPLDQQPGDLVIGPAGECARSVAWSRICRRGPIATTCPVSQFRPEVTPRPAEPAPCGRRRGPGDGPGGVPAPRRAAPPPRRTAFAARPATYCNAG